MLGIEKLIIRGDPGYVAHFACAWTPPPASIGAANAANAVARDQLPLLRTILDLPRMCVLVVHVRGELLTAKELQRLAADMHIADPRVVFVSGSRPGDFMGRSSSSSGCEGYEGYGGEGYEWAWAEEALKRGTRFVDACALAKMEV
ncbi:hypothetical protein FIBSPDRAFT_954862 [Athelia psychrophila]|uniref:Uncharacterized protein n=1 Tax=Athelia psychrophila TaxID=1759441 RepID=A0A166IN69_9AGAM|nr:hypothetical protein FIBSPDRAFT_954862 [Fibularhizoctonia sp. CBS 109695]